jgi:ABC-type branched-subunit amino acid transport system substrate-binding protein
MPGPVFGQLPPPVADQRPRVALLLPLSGAQAPLGRAMENAAILALFEHGGPRLEFVPIDTGGAPSGAAEAVRSAIQQGAIALVGPLTAAETSASSGAARAAGVPMLALTNDAAQAGIGVWALGSTPTQQVRRVVQAAAAQGARRFGLVATENEFGRRLAQALQGAMQDIGGVPPVVVLAPPRGDMASAARDLAARSASGLDAVLIGETGERARQAAAALVPAGIQVPPTRVLGHALWLQDGGLAQEPALAGAWFPGPDPESRARFEARYTEAFGARPPRLAAVAYDAAGLAARAARGGGGGSVAGGDLFLGADGPLRLLSDGQVARGLAVLAIDPSGEPSLIEPAAIPGQAGF